MKPFTVNLFVGNHSINFEIDTGSKQCYFKKIIMSNINLALAILNLKKNEISLSNYVSNAIKPMGKYIYRLGVPKQIIYHVSLCNRQWCGPPLIDRNDTKNIKCFTLFNIENDITVISIINKYNNDFKDDVCNFNKYLRNFIKHQRIKARPVPKVYIPI